MSKWVCSYCVMTRGLKGADLPNWPDYDDKEGQARHIESEHHLPVRRANETVRETQARFAKDYPEAGGPNCKCPQCVLVGVQ